MQEPDGYFQACEALFREYVPLMEKEFGVSLDDIDLVPFDGLLQRINDPGEGNGGGIGGLFSRWKDTQRGRTLLAELERFKGLGIIPLMKYEPSLNMVVVNTENPLDSRPDIELTIVHELSHAVSHQLGFRGNPRRETGFLVYEGFSEFISLDYLAKHYGQDTEQAAREMSNQHLVVGAVASSQAGGQKLTPRQGYAVGHNFFVHLFDEGGIELVLKALRHPPRRTSDITWGFGNYFDSLVSEE